MLDERWSEDELAVVVGLQPLLQKACDTSVVRAAESAGDGRAPDLEAKLDDFGLWELPSDPGVLAAAAWELGRALAPVPFVERAAPAAIGFPASVWAEQGWTPSAGLRAMGRGGDGSLVAVELGPPCRSTAGDVLAPATPTTTVLGPAAVADRAARMVRLLAAARSVGAAEGALALGVARPVLRIGR